MIFVKILKKYSRPLTLAIRFKSKNNNKLHYYMAEYVFVMRLVNFRSVTCCTNQNFKEDANFGVLNLFTSEKKVEIKLQDVYQP